MDDSCFSPLDSVVFNKKARRYVYQDNTKCKEKLHYQDDFILQVMVIGNLHRLEFGIGGPSALRNLSVWAGLDSTCELPNLWTKEIEQLQKKQPTGKGSNKAKLARGLHHQDDFDTFLKYYCNKGKPLKGRWARQSNTHNHQSNFVHVLAEQSMVQWVLHYYGNDYNMKELAVRVLSLQHRSIVEENSNVSSRSSSDEESLLLFHLPKDIPEVLLQVAISANGDGSFVKRALNALAGEDDDNVHVKYNLVVNSPLAVHKRNFERWAESNNNNDDKDVRPNKRFKMNY